MGINARIYRFFDRLPNTNAFVFGTTFVIVGSITAYFAVPRYLKGTGSKAGHSLFDSDK